MKIAKKISFIMAIVVLLISVIAISGFAAYDLKREGPVTLRDAGVSIGTGTYQYSSVGYKYLNAQPHPNTPNAYFTTYILSYEKEHWYSSETWVTLYSARATMRSTVYWGAGVDGHNEGQRFSFRLVPSLHVEDMGDNEGSISRPITIQDFKCESSE